MPARTRIKIGTRRSPLAMWQTEYIAGLLRRVAPGVVCDLATFDTTGDASAKPIAALGSIGVFTRELETAIRTRNIDAAVHSLKDLPTEQRDGLTLGAICRRDDVRDVLVSNGLLLTQLPPGARIGTSSPRRAAQIRAIRSDLCPEPIRGNVHTRIHKVRNGEFDAAVMAAAGLSRLGLEAEIAEYFPVDQFLPAPGQGALAVQCRANDEPILALLSQIDEPSVRVAVEVERAFLSTLEGGCTAPIGAHTTVNGNEVVFSGIVLSLDGSCKIEVNQRGTVSHALTLGREAAREALSLGARDLA